MKASTGSAGTGVVGAELLDELLVRAYDSIAALDLRLARGNPLRRLLIGSKGRQGLELVAHDAPPVEPEREASGGLAHAATDFPRGASPDLGYVASMTDNAAHARDLLRHNKYVVLATTDGDGNPWATPAWFAPDGLDRLYWVSWPGSRHSLLIEQRPAIALTVFDSTVVPGQGAAFYATATARQVPDDELKMGLRIFNQRSLAQGLSEFARQDVTGQARPRLYVAEFSETWVLDQDADFDQRAPVPRCTIPGGNDAASTHPTGAISARCGCDGPLSLPHAHNSLVVGRQS